MKTDNNTDKIVKDREFQIFNIIRSVAEDYYQAPFLLLIAAYFAKTSLSQVFALYPEKHCKDRAACQYLEDYIYADKSRVDVVKHLSTSFEAKDLKEFVLTYNPSAYAGKIASEKTTSDSLCNLAVRLLDVKESEMIGDIGSGIGSFFLKVATEYPKANIYGVEINESSRNISILRLAVAGVNADIKNSDAFESGLSQRCNKIFSNFPFGIRITSRKGYGKYYAMASTKLSKIGKLSSSDWLFNMLTFDSLAPGGRAVTITTNGAAMNESDKQARKYFVENGMIQAVIALPEKMLAGTSIPATMYILGENHGNIRMVDATDLYVEERRQNTMDDACIEELMHRIAHDGEKSKLVDIKEIACMDYILYPNRHMQREPYIENPTFLGDLAKSINRSAGFRASDLDKMVTTIDTHISYLQLADIEDGRIKRDLNNLNQLEKGMERYIIQNGDLLISKNGAPFKIAVAEIPEMETIISNGNLYVVRLDQTKVNPYYLAAFFASEDGKMAVSNMAVGTTIPSLPIKNLKNIKVPLLDMDVQEEIARKYQSALDEIEIMKIKTEKARIEMVEAYSTGVEHWQL